MVTLGFVRCLALSARCTPVGSPHSAALPILLAPPIAICVRRTRAAPMSSRPGRVLLFGDGELVPRWPAAAFPELGVACDYTECGAHVCGGIAEKHGIGPIRGTWLEIVEKLIELYGEDAPVEAHGNGIARQLWEHGIKTLGDLKRFLVSRL